MTNTKTRSLAVPFILCGAMLGSLTSCAPDDSSASQELTILTCPEAVTLDSRRDPRNAAGFIRSCWPGDRNCFCDQDNDCYSLEGYVPCAPPSTSPVADAGLIRVDSGTARADSRTITPTDAARDAAVTTDSGARDVAVTADTGVRDAAVTTDSGARDVAVTTDAPSPPPPPPPAPPAPPPPAPPAPVGGVLGAFPGAQGFGAQTTGGRGGRVIEVTTLASSGAGSLADALGQTGPRTVVFRVSGVIRGGIWIQDGNVTIAGQTSPGGITLDGGLICDNVYEPTYSCRNVIVRNMRIRNPNEDCVRLGGTERVILDHVSLEQAGDESLEITRSHDITVQQSLIAEPVGDHFRWGGVLINYSKDIMPLDNITIHHTVWNGVHGRLPEISCEENSDGPGRSNCAGRTIHIELTNNVMFDVFDPVWYNRCVGVNAGNDCTASATGDFHVNANFANNIMHRRNTYGIMPMFVDEVSRGGSANGVFYAGSTLVSGLLSPVNAVLSVPSASARYSYPAVATEVASGLTASLQRSSGAFPRDPMDARILGYMSSSVDLRPASWGTVGIDRGDRLLVAAPSWAVPTDSDHDGMSDDWERTNGLNPALADNNGTTLSTRLTGVSGYTNLECYVNQLADDRVRAGR